MTEIYAVMRNGLGVITGRGHAWELERRFADEHLEAIDLSPERPDRIYCGTFEDGLHRSTNGGDSFERVGEADIESDHVLSVTVSPHDPDVIWAGTEPSAVYRSDDGGDTWKKRPGLTELPSASMWFFPARPDSHRARCIEPSHNDPHRVYVGIELGNFAFTLDGGQVWRENVPGARRDTHQIVTHPAEPDRMYAASGFGYAESRDGGTTWTRPEEGLTKQNQHLWSVAPDPGDPETVVASTSRDAFAAHFPPAETYLHRLREGVWERLDDNGVLSGEGVFATSLAPGATAGELYALNNRGVFRSTDTGDHWERLAVDWPDSFEEQDPRGLRVIP